MMRVAVLRSLPSPKGIPKGIVEVYDVDAKLFREELEGIVPTNPDDLHYIDVWLSNHGKLIHKIKIDYSILLEM